MLLTEYLPDIVVIGQGDEPARDPALAGLLSLGAHPAWADARDDAHCRATLAAAAAHAHAARSPALLLVAGELDTRAAFGRPDDALVERLESNPWSLLYLVHEDGRQLDPGDARPAWLHCDAPPQELRALALSLPLLTQVLARAPALGATVRLAPLPWLAWLAWHAARVCQASQALALWPALPGPGAPARIAL